MNKMVTKVFAVTTGAAMFAGMFAAGIGAPAKQADAYNTSTAAGWANLMGVYTDNATNVQVFKTDYGYGAWATDSNGNIIGDEPISQTPYYLADSKLNAKKDTVYGDFVAAYEVDLFSTKAAYGIPGGNTVQTYYDVADFATNITDHYDHFALGLPIWQNDYTSSASLDANGGDNSPYIFGFEFGDYNPNYVEFVGTTWNVKNYNNKDKAFVDNTQIGVWTSADLAKKYGDFGAWLGDTEVYANPVFEDGYSMAYDTDHPIDWDEEILTNYNSGWRESGQFMPDPDGSLPIGADYGWAAWANVAR